MLPASNFGPPEPLAEPAARVQVAELLPTQRKMVGPAEDGRKPAVQLRDKENV